MVADLSLVIACYKDAPHLIRNVEATRQFLQKGRLAVEWIFIEDGGHDGSEALLERIRSTILPEARLVVHDRNRGRGATVAEGFDLASGRIVGFIDIDLALSPVYIQAMVHLIDDLGADVATARRIYRTSFAPDSLIRDITSYGYRLLTRAFLGLPFPDTEAGYKFMTRDAWRRLSPLCRHPGWFWDTEIMAHSFLLGLKVMEFDCLYRRDRDKVSTVRIWRDSCDYLGYLWRFRRRYGTELLRARRARLSSAPR